MNDPTTRTVIRWAGSSVRFTRRSALTVCSGVVVIVVLAIVSLMTGEYGTSVAGTVAALLGSSDDTLAVYFVNELRAPRVVLAIAVGAALGAAGSIFQTLTRNPLGSPDIIGFTTGAATGALVQIIVVGGDPDAIALGALLGGLATAALVMALTGTTTMAGPQLVLVGIGVGLALAAVNTLLVVRASLDAAQTAAQWLAGSLNATQWPRALLVSGAVLVLLATAALISRELFMLALGDEHARAAGINVSRARTVAVLLGVTLVSVATAATGPVAFVALAAPQVARRLAGTATAGIAGPAVLGSILVLGSDLIARRLLAPDELAVGVVTGALGGIYLVALLALPNRRRSR